MVEPDIKNQLLASISKRSILHLAEWAKEDLVRLDILFQLMRTGSPLLKSRSARVVGVLVEEYPELANGREEGLIQMSFSATHEGFGRELLRMLCFVRLPEHLQGELLDFCLTIARHPAQPLAWRVYAMEIAYRISQHSDELLNELTIILADIRQQDTKPSVESRTRTILGKIERLQRRATGRARG